MSELSVGIVTANLLHLGEELDAISRVGINRLHVDVMDGVFCPGLTLGVPIVKTIPDLFYKDVHLMIDEPLGKVAWFLAAGADAITFHVEATKHPHRVLQELAGTGVRRGVALNPGTPVNAVEPLLDDLECLLLLAVDPGWGGQAFIPATERKLISAREMIEGREITLAVDGGVTKDNVGFVASLGVDLIVTGSAVFDGVAPVDNARFMLDVMRNTATTPVSSVGSSQGILRTGPR